MTSAMRNPYEVLGVSRTAPASEIKKAYRKLAKKHHPDANQDDSKAAARFAEVNSAYEIVGDEAKRKAFDSGEIDAEGKPRFQGFEGFAGAGGHPAGGSPFEGFSFSTGGFRPGGGRGGEAGGFEDILSSVFSNIGRRGRAQAGGFAQDEMLRAAGQDISAEVTITLSEAVTGTTRRIQLPSGKDLDFKIPAGLTEGQQIRLKGQGHEGIGGGRAGDVHITVRFAPHPDFKVDGTDLRTDLSISLDQAVLGGKVRVGTLDGAVDLAIPARTSSGQTFRLRGKGLPKKGGRGDLFATVRIALPRESDPELEALMRRWREEHRHGAGSL